MRRRNRRKGPKEKGSGKEGEKEGARKEHRERNSERERRKGPNWREEKEGRIGIKAEDSTGLHYTRNRWKYAEYNGEREERRETG